MKNLTFLLILFYSFSYAQKDEKTINQLLDYWHEAAATANFENYFNLIREDGVYMGTDATERWTKKEFMTYAKPYFDKGKAWTFVPLQRHIRFDKQKKMVWFDELLDTSIKICRGSGVMVYENGRWKIAQYVLSMTIPNEITSKVIPLKKDIEEKVIDTYKK